MLVTSSKGLVNLGPNEVIKHRSHLITLGLSGSEDGCHDLNSSGAIRNASRVSTLKVRRTPESRQVHTPTASFGETTEAMQSLNMRAMKRAVLLTLFLGASAVMSSAQQTGGYGVPGTGVSGTMPFNGVPTGNCSSTQTAVDTTTGNYYSCNNGAWQKVGPAAGGAPSGTAGGSLAGSYPNPSLAVQATNTLLGNNTGSSAAPAALTISQVAALLGLGTAANQPASAFDASGAASAAQAASLQKSNSLSDVASASVARTNLGLGTAATQASTAFDASGAAATAQANAIAASAPSTCANGSYACSASPALSGTPTAPTQAISTNNNDIATTAAVTSAIAGVSSPVSSVFARTGPIVAASGDYTVAQVTGAAPLASPAFTGTPTAPTQAISTNNTDIATTAAVTAALAGLSSNGSGTVSGQASGVIPVGSSSAVIAAQSHLDDGNTTSGQITSTEPFNVKNIGAFGTTTYASYMNSIISGGTGAAGGCALNGGAWYQSITAAVSGCVTAAAAGTGPRNTAGGIFVAYTQDNSASYYSEPVGVIGTATSLANGGSVYGANFIAQDQLGCCTSGTVLVGQENDVQPTSSAGPAGYVSGSAFRASLAFTNGNTGMYPFQAFEVGSNQTGAYWRTGMTTYPGAFGPQSVVFNINNHETADCEGVIQIPQTISG